jgi:predicted ATPase
MRIAKVNIKNFKKFHDLTIDLGNNPKKIVALIGKNGSGKSSVLDGLINYSISSTSHRVEKFFSPQFFYRENSDSFNSIFLFDAQNTLFQRERNLVNFRSPYRYNTVLDVRETKAIRDINENYDSQISSIHIDDRVENNYRLIQGLYNRYMHEQDKKPSEALDYIIGELNKSIKSCLDLEVANLGDIVTNKGSMYFKKSDSYESFSFNALSSGEKEVVDLLLDLYLRKEEYKGKIYVIDEPELHINTAIQRKLLIEIDKLIDDESQLWIATHSIGFIRCLQEELKDKSQIVEFREDLKYDLEVVTLTEMERSRADWKRIFDTALDDLNGLIAPKRIIYCEGRDAPTKDGRERGLDAKVFNNIFSNHYPETLFVSSGGNTELDQRSEIAFAILSKVFQDIEIWVFKDRDIASGGQVTDFDRQIYLNNQIEQFRVMQRWEIENYLFDKEVLKKYCLENNLSFDEAIYDAQVNDIVNQDVKSLFPIIKKICNITTSINADKFKENLSKYITPEMTVYKELEKCIFNRE